MDCLNHWEGCMVFYLNHWEGGMVFYLSGFPHVQ